MKSIIYWHPVFYRLTMRILYGREYDLRLKRIAELIPEGASVLEICCGPADLYRRDLKLKSCEYSGIDINPAFISSARSKGIVCKLADARIEELAPADYVVMQASLYQFLPDAESMVRKMLNTARVGVIISEPTNNLAQSRNPILAWLASTMTDPGTGPMPYRFNSNALISLFKKFRELRSVHDGPGRSELIGVFIK